LDLKNAVVIWGWANPVPLYQKKASDELSQVIWNKLGLIFGVPLYNAAT